MASYSALSRYYISFIRPMLEYGSPIFDNCTAHESFLLEQVQRRPAISCTGCFKRTSYTSLLRDLGWDTLQNRRKNAKLTLLFKIIHGLTPSYLRALLPPLVQDATTRTLRNRNSYRLPFSRTNYMSKSFIPSTIRQWNELDPDIKNCNTLEAFKSKIKFKADPMCKLYSSSPTPYHKYITQMRLGLSKLHSHLFTLCVIPDPFCPNCHHNKETPMHYLLECPAYAADRDAMLRGLRELLPHELPSNKSLQTKLLLRGSDLISLLDNQKVHLLVAAFIQKTNRFTS